MIALLGMWLVIIQDFSGLGSLKFLKTMVNKLFEFMHEICPGVQVSDAFAVVCCFFLRGKQRF